MFFIHIIHNTIGLDTIPELTWRTYIFSMIKIIQIGLLPPILDYIINIRAGNKCHDVTIRNKLAFLCKTHLG